MTQRNPRVSIGLPVFNGENFLEATLQSILNQTFEDFELILSDNASTDRTEEICRAYAAKDRRIRYFRQAQNQGAAANFNFAYSQATGEYFKWAAHDDLLAPTFLEKCVDVLNRNPEIILVHSLTDILDETGEICDYVYNGRLRTFAAQPRRRFHDLVCIHHNCYSIFGVMRSQILAKTPLHGNYGHADGVLLARLVLMGKFFEIPERLFISRQHPHQATAKYVWKLEEPDYYGFTQWMDGKTQSRILLPRWRMAWGFCLALWQTRINPYDWLACHIHIAYWIKMFAPEMKREVQVALQQIQQKVVYRIAPIGTKISPNHQ
jgi:glycosyltransferase involved in cell wall biosynthesis